MNVIDKQDSTGKDLRIGIVVSRFNESITESLLEGALKELKSLGVSEDLITVVKVPGAFEIPVTAKKLALSDEIDSVICLGCVIKGDTYHFELIVNSVTDGLMQLSLESGKSIVFEVLATDTSILAEKRSEDNGYNKGIDAARVAVEMSRVLKEI